MFGNYGNYTPIAGIQEICSRCFRDDNDSLWDDGVTRYYATQHFRRHARCHDGIHYHIMILLISFHVDVITYAYLWPFLLTWFNFNPSMDK